MGNPILTIGIPTYNRPESIKKSVRALLPQLNDQVVLRVWDNCSDTPVADLFTEEEKQKFKIVRNRTNIGGDANICGVVYHADTKWVWTLGDDDGPLPNAIKTILDSIEKYPDALFFKYNSYIEKDLHSFKDLTELCKRHWIFGNFLYISSGVFNRDKLLDDIQYYYINLSSMVGQTIYILKHLERKDEDSYFFKSKIVRHSTGGLHNDEDDVSEGVSWNALTFIKRSSIIFDVFHDKRKSLDSTLFAGIAQQYLGSLAGQSLGLDQTWQGVRLTISQIGFVNLIKYNFNSLIKLIGKQLLITCLPDSVYQRIKIKMKNSINKKLLEKETERERGTTDATRTSIVFG